MGSYLREKLRAAGISLRGFEVALTVKRGELRKVSQKMSIRCVLRGVSGTIPAMHRQGSQPPGVMSVYTGLAAFVTMGSVSGRSRRVV